MFNSISTIVQAVLVLGVLPNIISGVPMLGSNSAEPTSTEQTSMEETTIKRAPTLSLNLVEFVIAEFKHSIALSTSATTMSSGISMPIDMPELFTGSLAARTVPTATTRTTEVAQAPSERSMERSGKKSSRSVTTEGQQMPFDNQTSSNVTGRWHEPMYCAYSKKPLGFNRVWSVMVPQVPDVEGVCRGLWDNLKQFMACWNPSHTFCDFTEDGQGLHWMFLGLESCNSGMMESTWWEATKNEFGPIECHPYHWPGWEGRIEELEGGQ